MWAGKFGDKFNGTREASSKRTPKLMMLRPSTLALIARGCKMSNLVMASPTDSFASRSQFLRFPLGSVR
eukprot:2705412-Prorocentrum_lima.AAC.1